MIGVDTNVFLRFVVKDDADQHAVALGLLQMASREAHIFVHPIVWVEAEWVMRSTFRMERDAIADVLAVSLVSEDIVMPDADACEEALQNYRAGKADLVECLLAEINRHSGCRTTFTFDREAAELDGMRQPGTGES